MKFYTIAILFHLLISPEARLKKYPKLDDTAVLTASNITLTKNPCLTINAENYLDLMEKNDIIVDKTMLVEEIIESKETVHLITCPSKWGKSMNLNMLKTFFEIQVDEDGNPSLPLEQSRNYRLFKNGEIVKKKGLTKVLESPLMISKRQKLCNQYLGKYPVLLLDFADINSPTNYKSFLMQVKGSIAKTYFQHQYLKSVLKKELDRPNQRKLYNTTGDLQTADRSFDMFLWEWEFVDAEILSTSILFLCKLLYRHFRQKPIILFDGYDTPFNVLLTCGDFKEKTKITDFARKLLQTTFVENDCYTKGVITGVLAVAVEDIFPNTGQIRHHSFLSDDAIFAYFGFNEGEVGLIFDKLGFSAKSYKEASGYYFGYRTGEYYDLNATNMISVVSYVKKKKIDNYWFPHTNFIETHLLKLLNDERFRTIFIRLVFRDILELDLANTRFRINDYFDLTQLTKRFAPLTFSFKDPLVKGLKFLANIGYLTPVPSSGNSSDNKIRYKIASEEIRSCLQNLLVGYFVVMLDLNNQYKEVIYSDFEREFEFFLINATTQYYTTALYENLKKALEHLPGFFNKPMGKIELVKDQIRCTPSAARVLFDFGLSGAMAELPFIAFQGKYENDTLSCIPSIIMHDKHRNGIVVQYRFDAKYKTEMLEECKNYVKYFHMHNCTSVETMKLIEIYLLPNDTAEISFYLLNSNAYRTVLQSYQNTSHTKT